MNDTFSKQNDQFTNHHEILAVYICMTDIRANLGWHYNTLFSNVKKNLLYISQCSIRVLRYILMLNYIHMHLQCSADFHKKKHSSFFSKSLRPQDF